jgi:hypothetical protein
LYLRYDFNNLENQQQQQQQQSTSTSKINPLTQSLFINDVLLALLMNQMSEANSQQTVEGNESIIEDLLAEQQQQQQANDLVGQL